MLMIVNGMSTHNHFCICLPFSVSENLYGLENNHFTIFTFAEPLLSQGLFSCLTPNTLSPPFIAILAKLIAKKIVNIAS